MKYFMMSDLHGIHPNKVKDALLSVGFDIDNDNHTVVMSGDFTDGSFCYDDLLVKYFMNLDSKGKLIAVKGNHDYGTEGVYYQHNAINYCYNQYASMGFDWPHVLSDESRDWLISLPYQIETEDFYIAHGIYIKEDIGIHPKPKELLSVWGHPFNVVDGDIWWSDSERSSVIALMKYYKQSVHAYEKSLDKPLFLGHISVPVLGGYSNDLKIDENGFASFGKITWLDREVMKNNKVFVKVIEF